tara:strand:- start:33025 stop:33174 length:150 start_codon:yes stop_codon:yes gene_type:complete
MKEFLNIVQLQNQVLTALKSIFNMDNKTMSTIFIKVEKRKSPFDHLRKK